MIANINIKLNTAPTYIITFLPELVLYSGVWFVQFTLSLFPFSQLVNSVKKKKLVYNDHRLLCVDVESVQKLECQNV